MIRKRTNIWAIFCTILLLSACQRSLTSYVNPFIGTGGHGHTFPGAVLPFGAVQVGPDTRLDGWDGCSAYHYDSDTLFGFSHTHLSGTGCSDYGDLLIMPFMNSKLGTADEPAKESGSPERLNYDYFKSSFSHNNEDAHPGYYSVILDRSRIKAELTVHKRTALHRYNYPNAGRKGVVIDLKHRDVVVSSSLHRQTISTDDGDIEVLTGSRISSAWNPEQHFYFAIAFDCPIEAIVYYNDDKRVNDVSGLNGENCKALVYFPQKKKEITLTVGISAVDEQGAINNLKESLGLKFHKAKKMADATWEQALGQFEVEGGDTESRENFYTALYHCMTSPYLYSDADGRYRAMKHPDSTHHTILKTKDGHNIYTVFSVWDTYRTLHPLLNLTDPERSRDFVLTFLDHFQHGGELTMWELASHETHCMIGYHSASVILDAYRTGVLDDLSEKQLADLLNAMIATSNLPMLGRTEYARDGYLSSEYENESVSKTLEYAYDDWCIAQMVKQLISKSKDPQCGLYHDQWNQIYDEYIRRSQSWKNIMDANGFMHPRRNGAFMTPFNPAEVNNHFTEANSWQYSSYVPHDVNGWIEMIGGKEKAIQFLDNLFNSTTKLAGREQSDITGLIGQYAHGNEPSHHAAYLYAYLGQQYKTAELVRKICDELYHNEPDGLCGNEDCGQMSAWYVMSAMGFYPLCPGSGQYIIGSPLFDKVTIHQKNGRNIVIIANEQSKENCYVQSLKLNGKDYDKSFITIEQLRDGCTLEFVMGDSPNKSFASSETSRPHSQSDESALIIPAPLFDNWQQSFDNETVVKISGKGRIFYTLDGCTPTEFSYLYTGPFIVSSDATIKAVVIDTVSGNRSAVATHILTRTFNDRTLTYITKPDPQYYENGETGLIDRLHGTENFRIGGWQGWTGNCEVIIDLLEQRTVHSVGVECLDNMKAWIFYPTRVEVEVSADGMSFRPFGSIENKEFPAVAERQEKAGMHNFVVNSSPVEARYMRVRAVNYGKLPKWHISAGQQAWLFIDEIAVE
ncbi:MAG: GH92 family glycosyl hydrolase [Bacteroidales bacterium]|nr:GH92 family glycosyl hydrolase [Bacteroidales bacterium]